MSMATPDHGDGHADCFELKIADDTQRRSDNERSKVWNDVEHARGDAPHPWIRQADRPESQPGRDANDD